MDKCCSDLSLHSQRKGSACCGKACGSESCFPNRKAQRPIGRWFAAGLSPLKRLNSNQLCNLPNVNMISSAERSRYAPFWDLHILGFVNLRFLPVLSFRKASFSCFLDGTDYLDGPLERLQQTVPGAFSGFSVGLIRHPLGWTTGVAAASCEGRV